MNKELDETMMLRCIHLAQKAKDKGNTPVGSLIVLDNQIIAEAEEQTPTGSDMFCHAEIEAIRIACKQVDGKKLVGATLYTTVEPCFLCSFAIRQTSIRRVVFGCRTPHIGGASSIYPILTASDIPKWSDPPEVVFEVLNHECEHLFEKEKHDEYKNKE